MSGGGVGNLIWRVGGYWFWMAMTPVLMKVKVKLGNKPTIPIPSETESKRDNYDTRFSDPFCRN